MSICECGREWHGLSEAHCGACHQHFRSVSGFDVHRVFEPGFEGNWDTRRCLTLAEMETGRRKTGKPWLVCIEAKHGPQWVTHRRENMPPELVRLSKAPRKVRGTM